jgi:CHAT domain-containing protein
MDKYNLISVFSTSEVVSKTSTQIFNTIPSISLYGGIQYNLKSQKNNDLLVLDKSQLNKSLRTINNKSRGSFNTLKFTKTEIDNIDNILSRYNWKVNKISGEYATENNIKKIDQLVSPTILHFATHGFAFPVADTNISSKSTVFEKSNNPMQRSGLLFYASNNTWQGKRDSVIKYTGEDGVLTAEEVSNLDLTNTKLVVLSACQSGLGATKGTEGVYGLKRAFRLAGVDNLIVSLWPVPDKETMELMNLFYTELAKTKDIDVAFKIAQKTMRFKYTSNPWAWGGFVLIK